MIAYRLWQRDQRARASRETGTAAKGGAAR
jgi:hypothetical protein